MKKFFAGLRVKRKGKDELPKRGTLDCYKSHVKNHILNETGGKVDISGPAFKSLEQLYAGACKNVKEAGLGDTDHTPGTLHSVIWCKLTFPPKFPNLTSCGIGLKVHGEASGMSPWLG